jgi:hypothetical protein
MHLTGIMDAHEFRNRILSARDALKQSQRSGPAGDGALAGDQLAAMRGIEQRLDEIIALMKDRDL